ncbi:translocase of chloroplast 120, chloroplastic [Lotus japonicus]|uniref:translocase of chloroplast 120, chloroplastic n=1 Tax=Lotus japonicus TaxID=34305 RepID=UPI002582FDD2|nr:translocase of chloroplast 120, chloroplastic [Lotus japonicus]
MDHGVDVVDGGGEGESKRVVVDGVFDDSVVVGSDKSKDLEGEEVFQEAMEPQESFREQGDAVVDENDGVGAGGGAVGLDVVGENTDAAAVADATQEHDDFEEAIGVVGELGKEGEAEVNGDLGLGKDGQGVGDSVHRDGVDSGGTGDRLNDEELGRVIEDFEEAIGVVREPLKEGETEVIADQELEKDEQGLGDSVHLDGVDSGGTGVNLESSDWSGGKEVSGLDTDGEMLVKENGAVADGNSGLVTEKAEFDDSEFMTPRENGAMFLENGSTDKVDHVVTESNAESETNEVDGTQGNEAGELKEGSSDPEFEDNKTEVKLNASGVPSSEIEEDSNEEVHENSAHLNLKHQGEVITETKDDALGTNIIRKDRIGEDDMKATELSAYQAGSDTEHQKVIGEISGASPPELHETVQESGNSADETLSVQASAADQNGQTTDINNEDRNGEDGIQTTEVRAYENGDDQAGSGAEHQEAIGEITGASGPELHDTVHESPNSADETLSAHTSAADPSSQTTDINHEDRNGEDGIQTTKVRAYCKEDDQAGSVSEHQEAIGEITGDSPPELHQTVQESGNSTDKTLSVQASAADQNVQTTNITNEDRNGEDGIKTAEVRAFASQNGKAESVSEHPEAIAEIRGVSPPSSSSDETQSVRASVADQTPAAPSENSAGAGPPPVRPAGLGRAAPLLEPVVRVAQQPRVSGTVSSTQSQQMEDSPNGEAEEYDETREHLQMIRVKFLRLAHRLGQTPHNVVVAQVLYRLGLAEQLRGRNGGRVGAFSFDRASAMAEQLEAAGQEPLDFSCTIMVLGKTGVGKSATINSIFDEVKFDTSAFNMGTKKVQDVVGTVQGIKVRVIDTPGLLPSWSDQRSNEKILLSVKNFIKKTPPDIVLYLDRLDMQSRDFSDMPLLRTITEIFGPSIWFNAIVVLTHAASAPPDGPNGTASSYDTFVTQRSHVVQQAIRQAAGDMRLMNPVSLVENHSACRTNRAGQRVLPNGQVWKPHLLLLSFASKILAEANALLKLQDSPPGKPYTTRSRAPPLPFLLSTLLQSRPQLKLPEEQFGDEDSPDDDLDESSDSDDETELDELPPFKALTKAQVEKLSKAQKKAYFDELEYREKLLMKKQLKEERKRQKMMKKMAESAKDQPSDYSENVEEESGGAASVPVPMPDLALPASFDSDNPTHRYRYLDSSNQWLVRPVLETHGWDHDVGYEGLNVERLFVVREKVPLSFSGQITKDKKDANVQMEVTSSIKHGEGKATSLGFDMQTVGKDLAYTLRSETRFCNFRRNKATAGLSFTVLGDALSAGAKIEDKLIANKRFKVVVSGGAMAGRGDVAYGGSLEAQLRDKDYPLGRSLSTLGLSVMDWHGDLAVGCNVQSQIPVGRHTNLIARANLNNRGAGQISIRLNSSEQLQIALVGLYPLIRKLIGDAQQWQFGQ